MNKRLGVALSVSTIFIGAFALVPDAQAGGFIIRSQSATGFGMALAGAAAGEQLSYSFWNPAVLSHAQGLEIEAGMAAVLPSIDIHPDTPAGSSVDIGTNALVPASFAAMPVNERLTLGLAMTSPFGLATEAPDNWAGQIYSRSSEIFSLNVNPMASWRVNDMISIGAGIQFQYFKADLTQAVAAVPDAPSAALEADDIGVGFNLGIQVQPWDGTSIGLGYRSSISHDLDGHLSMPLSRTSARATLDTPDIVSLGLRQDITDRFRAFGTVEWNNWSRLGKIPVQGPTGLEPTLHLDYRDGWLFSLGAEYDVNERLTLRAGVGYEVSPLTIANRDTRLPEVDQLILSTGLSYAYSDRVTVAMSYLYSKGLGDGEIDIQSGNDRWLGMDFTGTSDLDVSIVSVGLNYKFGR